MKKKSYVARLGILALVLSIASVGLTGMTLARYSTEVTGNATATVAKWSFGAKYNNATITTIDLGATRNKVNNDTIKDEVIAPGTSGSFDIELDASGSDVAVDYNVTISKDQASSDIPTNLTFKVNSQPLTLETPIKGTIDYSAEANTMKKTITVSWEWPYGENANDNTDQGKKLTLDIKIEGTQVNPTPAS